MFRQMTVGFIFLLLGAGDLAMAQNKHQQPPPLKIFLREHWAIQSSAQVKEKGDVLSQQVFQPRSWYPATAPSPVVGTLVEDKVYSDPFVGMNPRLMPGCSYPIGANFSLRPMPEESPFRVSWWYRTEFQLPAGYRDRNIWLHLDGINFRANVWLNGKQIATSDQIAGTFRLHELNIRDMARAGLNTLAIEVFAQQPDDLGWTWVDWSPMPPDKNMGIFRDVYITSSGPVTLRYPQAVTHFDLPSLEVAHLTVNAEVHNASNREIEGTLSARIDGMRLSQSVKLGPLETKSVTFTPDEFPNLNIDHPRVWWPIHQGPQNLYNLEMEFATDGSVSDRQNTRFGIREITSTLTDQKHRLFRVNGKDILIRGGGWASDVFLRFTAERVKSEFQYVRDMNLNLIRLEGQLQPDYF